MTDFDIDKLPIKPTGRVIKAKEAFLAERPEMCCKRALIYTEVYRSLSGHCPTILLESKGSAQNVGRTAYFYSASGSHCWTSGFPVRDLRRCFRK